MGRAGSGGDRGGARSAGRMFKRAFGGGAAGAGGGGLGTHPRRWWIARGARGRARPTGRPRWRGGRSGPRRARGRPRTRPGRRQPSCQRRKPSLFSRRGDEAGGGVETPRVCVSALTTEAETGGTPLATDPTRAREDACATPRYALCTTDGRRPIAGPHGSHPAQSAFSNRRDRGECENSMTISSYAKIQLRYYHAAIVWFFRRLLGNRHRRPRRTRKKSARSADDSVHGRGRRITTRCHRKKSLRLARAGRI